MRVPAIRELNMEVRRDYWQNTGRGSISFRGICPSPVNCDGTSGSAAEIGISRLRCGLAVN